MSSPGCDLVQIPHPLPPRQTWKRFSCKAWRWRGRFMRKSRLRIPWLYVQCLLRQKATSVQVGLVSCSPCSSCHSITSPFPVHSQDWRSYRLTQFPTQACQTYAMGTTLANYSIRSKVNLVYTKCLHLTSLVLSNLFNKNVCSVTRLGTALNGQCSLRCPSMQTTFSARWV